MAPLAICSAASVGSPLIPVGKQRMRGFTLVEMLVVMVLMGLLSALALPAMQRWHDAVQARAQAAVVLDALRAAAFAAGASRRDIVMDGGSFMLTEAASRRVPSDVDERRTADSGSSRPEAADTPTESASPAAPAASAPLRALLSVPLPLGWSVKRTVTATFLSNGLCRPGLVALQTERGEEVMIQVLGPVCGVELTQPVGAT